MSTYPIIIVIYSTKLPPPISILYCTGSETKYCPSQFCYNALSLHNQKYTQGCAKKNECIQTGCTLIENNKFICCCATDNCNDLKMSTLKIYFQDYMSFEENNLEYFSRTIRSKPHLIKNDKLENENFEIKNKKTSEIIEDEKLLPTNNAVIHQVKDNFFKNIEINEGSGLDNIDNIQIMTNNNNYKKSETTVVIDNKDKEKSIIEASINKNTLDKERTRNDIKEILDIKKNNKVTSNRFIEMIVNSKRSVAIVHELVKPYPWYFVTAGGFILSLIIIISIFIIIKKVKQHDSHEVISQHDDDNELEFIDVTTKKNKRQILKEIKDEENVELINKE
uniref:Activin types I and II receptor domain-containing protein n=1 Tax=Strongyloides stercoralis TaxID=6248 RepID=A0AAF5D3Y7_STRER